MKYFINFFLLSVMFDYNDMNKKTIRNDTNIYTKF